jgi:hypothetical protein
MAAWNQPALSGVHDVQTSQLDATLRQRDDEARRLREELEAARAEHRTALSTLRREADSSEEALAEAQAAVKLLMSTVKERDAAVAKYEGHLAELQGAVEALRRGRDELGRAMQVGGVWLGMAAAAACMCTAVRAGVSKVRHAKSSRAGPPALHTNSACSAEEYRSSLGSTGEPLYASACSLSSFTKVGIALTFWPCRWLCAGQGGVCRLAQAGAAGHTRGASCRPAAQ